MVEHSFLAIRKLSNIYFEDNERCKCKISNSINTFLNSPINLTSSVLGMLSIFLFIIINKCGVTQGFECHLVLDDGVRGAL